MSKDEAVFRVATRADLPAVLALLHGDELTRSREPAGTEATDAAYWAAFEAIDADPRNELIVMELGGDIVGTCQLTFIPSLSRGGAERLLVESVHVRGDLRGQGLGGRLMAWVEEQGRHRGSGLVQLTSHKRRTDAHRFYSRLGYEQSHEGFKKAL